MELILIYRYTELLRLDKPNPYNISKAEWQRELKDKIFELNSIISRNNFKTISPKPTP